MNCKGNGHVCCGGRAKCGGGCSQVYSSELYYAGRPVSVWSCAFRSCVSVVVRAHADPVSVWSCACRSCVSVVVGIQIHWRAWARVRGRVRFRARARMSSQRHSLASMTRSTFMKYRSPLAPDDGNCDVTCMDECTPGDRMEAVAPTARQQRMCITLKTPPILQVVIVPHSFQRCEIGAHFRFGRIQVSHTA